MPNLKIILYVFFFTTSAQYGVSQNRVPVRIAVAGLSHGHNRSVLNRIHDSVINVVGIYEPNVELASRLALQYKVDQSLFYTDLNTMLDKTNPEGVLGIGTTFDHLTLVEACAPRHIPVMVEKPLAVSKKHVEKIALLAKKYNAIVLTNYESAWYPTTEKAFQLSADSSFMGKVRKVVVHDGHMGPKEIQVMPEFFDWLTDPILNGGGALMDFGCYGANLMTYLMKGQFPTSVTAITRNFRPDVYSKVDDEATIILTYPTTQCIIEASWNWSYNRKDMEIYGEFGSAITDNNKAMRIRGEDEVEHHIVVTPEETNTYTDPIKYFADVILKKIAVPKFGLYSLENNIIVIKILEAAKKSSRLGRTVKMKS